MGRFEKRKSSSESEEENESDYGEDMLDMVEKDDLDFIKKSITSKSYNIFNKIRYSGPNEPKTKKRKVNHEESDLENEYEENVIDEKPKRNLLPIKTKSGIIPQQMETAENVEDEEVDSDEVQEPIEEFDFIETKYDLSKPISAAQLMSDRNKTLNERKIHIGTLSAGILENPEEKVTNLRTLLELMEEKSPEVYFSVRKLATVSLLEVFKDILPSYEIKKFDSDGVKFKKDTLKLKRYEESLVQYYKRFLQKLERMSLILVKKKGDTRKLTNDLVKLGVLAVQTLSDLLVTHPHFNYATNVAQAVVPFLNHHRPEIREVTKNAIQQVFKEDKKKEMSLKVMRIINSYLRSHAHNVYPEMLEPFLVLKLQDVNLDSEREQDVKQKKLNAKKHKVLQLSKKEKKRKKKLQFLEKELLETKAEESKQAKQSNLTEITKILFGIYFRILKSSTNTKVLGICLEGLAKFSHCINVEFYMDLVNILDKLLKEDWLGYREQLNCVQTVLTILTGLGEALNIDPTRFYTCLYKDLLTTTAAKNYEHLGIVLKTLNDALIKRRKKITNKRLIGFIKKISCLSLQLLHNGAISSLCLIKQTLQLNRSVDILLDMDTTFGDGKYQPDLPDPEYSNASSTALYELILLNKHYHPIVCKFAKNITFGVPSTGEGSLDPEYAKCDSMQLFKDFDMTEMAFNPAVPIPKKVTIKDKTVKHLFVDNKFEDECKEIIKSNSKHCKLL